MLLKDAASGIPRKVDLNKFDITLIEKHSLDAPKPSGIGINSPEMIALESGATLISINGRALPIQSGYVYRGISNSELQSIIANGQLVGRAKNVKMGDSHYEKYVYADPCESEAAVYGGAVIRIKTHGKIFELDREDTFASAIISGRDKLPESIEHLPAIRTANPIPVADIEVKVNGEWSSLASYAASCPEEKLSDFAREIGLHRGRYFCKRCETQTHQVDFEGLCRRCSLAVDSRYFK